MFVELRPGPLDLQDVVERLVGVPQLQQSGDGVQPVRELVLLSAQGVGQAALTVQLAAQAGHLGAIPQRHDRAVRAPGHRDGHPVDHQDHVVGEDDVVPFGVPPGERITQAPLGQYVVEVLPHRAHLDAQQPLRLVVHDADAVTPVEGDDAFAHTVQHALALLQQLGDLVEFQPERPAFEVRRETERRDRAEGERDCEPRCVRGEFLTQRTRDRALPDAHGHLADHPAVEPVERRLAVRRTARAPVVRTQMDTAVRRDDRLRHRLSDQRRIRM
ncbi:hypothetical protein LVQ62_06470 [Allobranchiibius sp. GilTou73]|nr:hypothetical protein [Allobranchiibius sp. GilTou73]UIJ36015.1 hypothetical protein LVQ62_06470 [Allobranchiibius sp. GilTou73]